MNKPKVGQVIYYVPFVHSNNRTRTPARELTVTKVGNKYFECESNRSRFRISDWVEDFGHYSGRAYLSAAHHEEALRRIATWRQFHDAIRHEYRAPEDISTENIREAAQLLGIEIKEPVIQQGE
jgi:hypothetical protein